MCGLRWSTLAQSPHIFILDLALVCACQAAVWVEVVPDHPLHHPVQQPLLLLLLSLAVEDPDSVITTSSQ